MIFNIISVPPKVNGSENIQKQSVLINHQHVLDCPASGHWILKNCAYFWPKISCDESFTISSHDLDEMLGRQFLIMSSHNSLLMIY
jgi:hypothetical protein